MKTSSVYYKAAELIANNEAAYCCHVLRNMKQNKASFEKLFKPRKKDFYNVEGIGDVSWFGVHYKESNQLARTLALLLMAEMESNRN